MNNNNNFNNQFSSNNYNNQYPNNNYNPNMYHPGNMNNGKNSNDFPSSLEELGFVMPKDDGKLDEEMEKTNKMVKIVIIVMIVIPVVLGLITLVSSLFSKTATQDDSKYYTYLDIAKSYIQTVEVEMNKVKKNDPSTLFLIPIGADPSSSCYTLETGGISPFSGSYKYAYAAVVYNEYSESYNVFISLKDGENNVIPFTNTDTIDNTGISMIQTLPDYGTGLESYYSSHLGTSIVDSYSFNDNSVVELANALGIQNIRVFAVSDCKK